METNLKASDYYTYIICFWYGSFSNIKSPSSLEEAVCILTTHYDVSGFNYALVKN